MSERQPSVSGKTLIRFLESLGYEVGRQRGSHVRLAKATQAGCHKIIIPNHDPVARGTLADIVTRIALWCQMDKEEILRRLRSGQKKV